MIEIKNSKTVEAELEMKVRYIETLEDRIQRQNKKNDEMELEINSLHVENHLAKKKYKELKKSYEMLYNFAKNICDVIEEKDNQIGYLIEVNEELRETNNKICDKFQTLKVYEEIRKIL